MSLAKWPPCATRTAPTSMPATAPTTSQRRRVRAAPSAPKAISTKPVAAWPLTNEQLCAHSAAGSSAGVNALLPPNAATECGRARPQCSLKTPLTSKPRPSSSTEPRAEPDGQ